jgi:hypothetical protein
MAALVGDRSTFSRRCRRSPGRPRLRPDEAMSEFDRDCIKTQTTCRVGSIARNSSQQSHMILNPRARKRTAPLVPQWFSHGLDPELPVATGRYGAHHRAQPMRSRSVPCAIISCRKRTSGGASPGVINLHQRRARSSSLGCSIMSAAWMPANCCLSDALLAA